MSDLWSLAQRHRDTLRFAAFVPASSVSRHLAEAEGLAEAASLLRAAGVTKVYLDVYRAHIPDERVLTRARDFFRGRGFEVSGGLTTVAGNGYGKPSSHGVHWFCWTNRGTQQLVEHVSRLAARLFDEIIVDDFLCTQCRCEECERERGLRDFPRFYREQMVDLARRALLQPAKEENPNARLIIKYPQWYDRFHAFGYDVLRQPGQFDATWAGTETRDVATEFVHQYQAYVNYRWLESLAGERLAGAWFDQIACYPAVYVEQAYQSVLAGAREVVLFDYQPQQFAPDNPNLAHLKAHLPRLFRLARALKRLKPVGIAAYKPPDSDGDDEAYLFDYLGMFGLPLAPCSAFPEQARSIVLSAHAAADRELPAKLEQFLARGGTALLTGGLLGRLADRPALLNLAGYADHPVTPVDAWTCRFAVGEERVQSCGFVRFGARLNPTSADILASAVTEEETFPILTEKPTPAGGSVLVLSARTLRYPPESTRVTVGEPVPLIHLPDAIVALLRSRLLAHLGLQVEAPSRVGVYAYGRDLIALCNFNDKPVDAAVTLDLRRFEALPAAVRDLLGRERVATDRGRHFAIRLEPRATYAFRLGGR